MERFKDLTHDILIYDIKNFRISEDSKRYIESYPFFIDYFNDLKRDLEKKDIIIASHFVYGWMPTVLKHINITDEHLNLLNLIKYQQVYLNKDELESLTQITNNSVVGLSKLLHFIAPDLYPIWDSNICFYWTNKKYQANNIMLYIKYREKLKEIIGKPEYNHIHKNVCDKIESYKEVSRFRSCEMILFELGKQQKRDELH